MKEGVLAQRYAKALFAIALERDLVDKIHHDFYEFVAILEEKPALDSFFCSPMNTRATKREAVERTFQDRFSSLFVNFLLLLVEKGRSELFLDIHRAFNNLYDRYHRKLRALAISAIPLSDDEITHLGEDLSRKLKQTLEIENRVDPSILGGLILNIDGKIMDGSLRGQLDRLQELVRGRLN